MINVSHQLAQLEFLCTTYHFPGSRRCLFQPAENTRGHLAILDNFGVRTCVRSQHSLSVDPDKQRQLQQKLCVESINTIDTYIVHCSNIQQQSHALATPPSLLKKDVSPRLLSRDHHPRPASQSPFPARLSLGSANNNPHTLGKMFVFGHENITGLRINSRATVVLQEHGTGTVVIG